MQSDFDSMNEGCGSTTGAYYVPGQEEVGYITDDTTAGYDQPAACPSGVTAGKALTAVLGGAGVGAIMMYLLDPREGAERRHHLAEMASGAWDVVREKAGQYGNSAYESAGHLKDRVAHSGFGGEAYDRARYLVRGRQSHGIESGMGQLFAGLGMLATGVAAMYYFDPQQGAHRRTQCSQKMLGAFNHMFRSLEGLGKDAWNRAHGLVHEAKSRAAGECVDDRVLSERVRAEMGRCVSNTGAIEIEARNGAVIVSGFVTAAEHDALLKCIWGTRGVSQLINRLEIRESMPPSIPTPGSAASSVSASQSIPACPPGMTSSI